MYFSIKTPPSLLFFDIDENHEIDCLLLFQYLINKISDSIIKKKLVVLKFLQIFDDKSKIIQVETHRQIVKSSSDLIGWTDIFIVFQTTSEEGDFWWSLDKYKDHIIVQRSHDKDAVKNNFKGERREGIELIAEKLEGKGCIREILTILWIHMIIDIKYQRNLSRCESIIPLIMKKITKIRYEYENNFKYSALSAEEENPDLLEIISFLSNVSNWHPLVIAIYLGDIELFDQVQQDGKYNVNGIYNKFTLLNLAILFSEIEMIQHLLEKLNVDPLKRDETGRNALHMAAKFNRETEIINLILFNHKIPIDQCDASGTTALNYAIMASNTKIVQGLLDKGADPKRLDQHDRSPLHVAAFYTRNTKIIDLLLENKGKVDVNECDKFGVSALHYAAKTSNHKTARHLMERGANVNCRDKRGLTPLHLAVFCAKDMDMINLFLNNKKINLHCCDELGQNVVAYAKKNIFGLSQQIIDRLSEKDGGVIKEYNLLKQAKSDMPDISIWKRIWNPGNIAWNPENKPTFFFIPCADLKPGKGCEISESALIRFIANEKTVQLMNWVESKTPGELNILNDIDRCSKITQVQIYQSALSYFVHRYYSFIIFKTTSEEDGDFWWSLEKNEDYIVLQRSRNEYDVKDKYNGKVRNQVKTISENLKGKGTIQDVFARLWTYQVVEEKYSNSHSLPFVTFVCEQITKIGYESPFDHKSDRKPVVENLIHILSSSISKWHPLFLAICLGNTKLLDEIQEMKKFNFNHGLTPLNLAISLPNKTEMVKHLLEKQNADPTLRDGFGRNALEMAAIHADNAEITDLVAKHKKVNINERDKSGKSALHFAATSSNVVAARRLIQKGANPNIKDENGRTPLHLAVFIAKDMKIINVLLSDKQLDVNSLDNFGRNALYYAKRNKNKLSKEIVSRLQEIVVKKNIVDNSTVLLSKISNFKIGIVCIVILVIFFAMGKGEQEMDGSWVIQLLEGFTPEGLGVGHAKILASFA